MPFFFNAIDEYRILTAFKSCDKKEINKRHITLLNTFQVVDIHFEKNLN